MEPSSIVLNAQLTAFVAGVKPPELIGLQVAPLIPISVISGISFTYYTVNPATYLTIPKTKIARRTAVPVTDFDFTQATASLDDHSQRLIHPKDIVQLSADQPPQVLQVPFNVRAAKAKMMVENFWLSHEKECVDLIFGTSNYAAGYYGAAAKNQMLDDPDVDGIKVVQDILDAPLIEPNTLVFGLEAWRPFQRNKKVVSSIKAILGDRAAVGGRVNEQEVASYFGIEKVLVGKQRYNTAAAGQTASYSRLWGKNLAAIRVETPPPSNLVPFGGFAATYHGVVMNSGPVWVMSRDLPEGENGAYGAVQDLVAHTRKVGVTNSLGGYLLTGVVS